MERPMTTDFETSVLSIMQAIQSNPDGYIIPANRMDIGEEGYILPRTLRRSEIEKLRLSSEDSDMPDTGIKLLYDLIGCMLVQYVPINDAFEIWIDEEGAINGSPVNEMATLLLGSYVHGGRLHGHVVLLKTGIIK